MSEKTTLAQLLESNREALLSEWRRQVRELPDAKDLSVPTLNDHIPLLIDALVGALKAPSNETIPQALANMSAYSHGLQRLGNHYDIAQMVSEYNILRGCIHDLAFEHDIVVQGRTFHILNRVLDGAIGAAVQTFATQEAIEVRRQREEYLSFVAHDLRTPLTAISMATGILELGISNAKAPSIDTPSLLKIIRSNVSNLASLVANILKENTSLLAETGINVEPRLIELRALVETILEELRPLKKSECAIENEIAHDVTVFGDATLLGRVFQNLVANAIEHTPVGEVKIGAMQRGSEGSVECWVTDTGVGIPADRIDAIFQKFETGPDSKGGVGLGLSIVDNFVRAHNGKVTVESKEGVGSTFHILLPGPTAPDHKDSPKKRD